MTRDQAIKYIKKVLKTWHAFNRSHGLMCQALTTLLSEVTKNDIRPNTPNDTK